ncbi:uncharacterized protein LOC130526787 [Takifugu flavidus]|uniref:uncharacterized protein LOC130526787 n=1 Tax=Takifugu flavidus TaxID=433684 RepID=UPI002544620F|nr:uncharacterized protein LOC130526787 [Takifugu flavidus]
MIRHDVAHLSGSPVDFHISSATKPEVKHKVQGAFTAGRLSLTEQSYPVAALQKRYDHLRGLPIQSFDKVYPLLLIGADNTGLIAAKEQALQGPDGLTPHQVQTQALYFTNVQSLTDDLYRQVERLWQVDVLPFRSEKLVVRSRQDQEAIKTLESGTVRVKVGDTRRYATPLPRKKDAPPLRATMEAVMASLWSIERRLKRDPVKAQIYEDEIQKLIHAGCVAKLHPKEVNQSEESWFIPHHLVEHNGKHRLVFNCLFSYQGLSLNEQLLAGPALGPSRLGVLLRFRQHPVAVSGDICAMFHQVRLLPEDQPLLRFIWRNLRRDEPPDVYEWQVLPFGTTSSPCCATFAMQKHVKDYKRGSEEILQSLEQSFYIDNCLQSLPTVTSARRLVDKLRQVLQEGGFEIRQWASNDPDAVAHLPSSAKAESTELWITQKHPDP